MDPPDPLWRASHPCGCTEDYHSTATIEDEEDDSHNPYPLDSSGAPFTALAPSPTTDCTALQTYPVVAVSPDGTPFPPAEGIQRVFTQLARDGRLNDPSLCELLQQQWSHLSQNSGVSYPVALEGLLSALQHGRCNPSLSPDTLLQLQQLLGVGVPRRLPSSDIHNSINNDRVEVMEDEEEEPGVRPPTDSSSVTSHKRRFGETGIGEEYTALPNWAEPPLKRQRFVGVNPKYNLPPPPTLSDTPTDAPGTTTAETGSRVGKRQREMEGW